MEKKSIEYVLPEEIEKRSFEIIAAELAERGITLPAEQDPVTRRVIHTSADFDYAETMTYSENAVEIAKNLIENGADIVTDTNMALAGINKKVLASFGGEAHCYMADADVAAMAKERKTTRAAISMELASKLEKPVIFAVGNAPTALIQIYELMQERDWRPAFASPGQNMVAVRRKHVATKKKAPDVEIGCLVLFVTQSFPRRDFLKAASA